MEDKDKQTRGQPRRFSEGQDLIDHMLAYVKECKSKKRLPNVAGFCVYCKMSKETFYQHRGYYPDAFDMVNSILEDHVINDHFVGEKLRMLYLMNKFGYTNRSDQVLNVPNTIKVANLDRLSEAELLAMKSMLEKAEEADDDPIDPDL